MIQTVLDSIPSAVFWKDRDSIYLGGNRTWLEVAGLKSSEEVVGKSDYDLPWEKKQADAFREDDRRVMESGIPEYGIIEPYLRADGTRAWARTNKVPLRDTEGNVTGVLGTYEDITESKRIEEALRESEERLRLSLEGSGVSFWEWFPESGHIHFDDRWAKTLGYEPGEEAFDFQRWEESVHPDSKPVFEKALDDYLEGRNKRYELEYLIKTKAGDWKWIWAAGECVEWDKNKKPVRFLGTHRDITENKRAVEALKESEAQKRAILDSSLDRIRLVDRDLRIIWANKTTTREINITPEELVGKICYELFAERDTPCPGCPMTKALKSGKIEHAALHQPKSKGIHGESYWDTYAVPIKDELGNIVNLIEISRNITERKKTEEEKERLETQLHQSQKMEAVGTLAGGIAHDFNNILAIILGNAELASADVPDWNPASHSLKEIQKASIRAKDMIQQLLAFSRKTDGESKPLNMAPIIKESMKMLRSAIPTSVEFREHVSDDPCTVMGDAAQINQIVMNLVTNAADAMSKEGGLLEVTLEKIILGQEKPCFDWVLSPGAYVRLRMRDTGEGIDPKVMDRIFDPYYTSKEVGKGTGMGLSVIHGIVKRHGGGIRVESELGKGTLFEIYFPALDKTAEEEKEPEGEIKGGSERILFVDDEESMVNLNRQRLERLGYDVRSTTKPVDALEWFKADPDQFDVIITDMTMPRMTGDRLAAEVLKIRPRMPVIICTGYSERMSAKKAEALGVSKYIEKPIDFRNLASALREVLEGK